MRPLEDDLEEQRAMVESDPLIKNRENKGEFLMTLSLRMAERRIRFSGQIKLLRHLYGEEFATKAESDAIELQKYYEDHD